MANSQQFKPMYDRMGIDLSKLGCVMFDLKPLDSMLSHQPHMDSSALYYANDATRFWIKGWVVGSKAHVTALYGLIDPAYEQEENVAEVLQGVVPDAVEIDHIGFFPSPFEDEPYYCIVAHIKPEGNLLEANKRLELLPHINTYDEYKPHMTVAYIDASMGEAYRDELIKHMNGLWSGAKLAVTAVNTGSNKS